MRVLRVKVLVAQVLSLYTCNLWFWCTFMLFVFFRGGSYFPYILLNEIQTMFSQLAMRSARVLPADLCTDHAHYVKIHRSTVLRSNKNMAVDGGTVSQYYILVIRKFIDLVSLFRQSVWLSFLLNNFPLQSFEYATYSSVQLITTAEELSYRAVFCSKP